MFIIIIIIIFIIIIIIIKDKFHPRRGHEGTEVE